MFTAVLAAIGIPMPVVATTSTETPARVLVLGDSVFHSFHHIASARRLMNAQQPTIFATQTCQRLVSPGCRPSARLSTLDQLRKFAGQFTDVVVIGTGYNDRIGPDFKAAVAAITSEARIQGVDVLWVNYREVRHVRGKAEVMNEQLARFDRKIDNLHVVDWNTHSANGKGWFRPDRLHLIGPGADKLAELLNQSLASLLAARDAARATTPTG
jgi:lysophospholipase L1-like esterase